MTTTLEHASRVAGQYGQAVSMLRSASRGVYSGPSVSEEHIFEAIASIEGLDTDQIRQQSTRAVGARRSKGILGVFGKLIYEVLMDIASGVMADALVSLLGRVFDNFSRAEKIEEETERATDAIDRIEDHSCRSTESVVVQLLALIASLCAIIRKIPMTRFPFPALRAIELAAFLIEQAARFIMGICLDRDDAIGICLKELCDSAERACEREEEPKPEEKPKPTEQPEPTEPPEPKDKPAPKAPKIPGLPPVPPTGPGSQQPEPPDPPFVRDPQPQPPPAAPVDPGPGHPVPQPPPEPPKVREPVPPGSPEVRDPAPQPPPAAPINPDSSRPAPPEPPKVREPVPPGSPELRNPLPQPPGQQSDPVGKDRLVQPGPPPAVEQGRPCVSPSGTPEPQPGQQSEPPVLVSAEPGVSRVGEVVGVEKHERGAHCCGVLGLIGLGVMLVGLGLLIEGLGGCPEAGKLQAATSTRKAGAR